MAGLVKEFEVHPYVQFMLDKYSPYKKWIESEGVPIIGGAFVQDVRTRQYRGTEGRKGHRADRVRRRRRFDGTNVCGRMRQKRRQGGYGLGRR